MQEEKKKSDKKNCIDFAPIPDEEIALTLAMAEKYQYYTESDEEEYSEKPNYKKNHSSKYDDNELMHKPEDGYDMVNIALSNNVFTDENGYRYSAKKKDDKEKLLVFLADSFT